MMRDDVASSSIFDPQVQITREMAITVALKDAVEETALQHLAGTCGLLQCAVSSPASSSCCAGIGPNSSSSSSSTPTSNRHAKLLRQHYNASDMPAFDESLLQLLPGGQAYVDALAAMLEARFAEDSEDLQVVRTDGGVKSIALSNAAARHIRGWANTAAHLLCCNY
jgi:hypothetical protein